MLWLAAYFLLSKFLLFLSLTTSNAWLHTRKLPRLDFILFVRATFLFLSILVNTILIDRKTHVLVIDLILNELIVSLLRNFNLVGITGPCGSGKREFLSKLRDLHPDLAVVDCDQLCREMFEIDYFRSAVVSIFSKFDVLSPDRSICKEKLAKASLTSEGAEARTRLERLVHARVAWKALNEVFYRFFSEGKSLVVISSPLLLGWRIGRLFCFPIFCFQSKSGQIESDRAKNGTEIIVSSHLSTQDALRVFTRKLFESF